MNCERATELYTARLAGELQGADHRALEAHLQGCSSCREETARLAGLWKGLGLIPEAEPGPASRLRFEQMLAAWKTAPEMADRVSDRAKPGRRAPWTGLRGWFAGIATARPAAQWAGAVALLACGFIAGSWVTLRGGEMRALRQELQSTRSMMTLSLLQQRSPADRLQGIGYSTGGGAPEPRVIDALFETLDHDPSVDVRLAAVDAIGGLHPTADVGSRLVNSLRGQTSPLVQVALLGLVVRWHESNAQPVLQEMAADPHLHKSVRERAEWALRQLTL